MSYVRRPRASSRSHTQLRMHHRHGAVLLRVTAPRLLLASAEEELQGQAPMHASRRAECTRPPADLPAVPAAGGISEYMETCMSARRRSAWLIWLARSARVQGVFRVRIAHCGTTRLFSSGGRVHTPSLCGVSCNSKRQKKYFRHVGHHR